MSRASAWTETRVRLALDVLDFVLATLTLRSRGRFVADVVVGMVNVGGLRPALACEIVFGATDLRDKIEKSKLPADVYRAAVEEVDREAVRMAAASGLPFR